MKKKANVINIRYEGRVVGNRLIKFINAADIFVAPSQYDEPFGRVVIEALACATPIIASQNIPSAYATLTTGKVYMEPTLDNPNSFSKLILEKIRREEEDSCDWNKIFEYLIHNYSWKNISNSYVKLYLDLIN